MKLDIIRQAVVTDSIQRKTSAKAASEDAPQFAPPRPNVSEIAASVAGIEQRSHCPIKTFMAAAETQAGTVSDVTAERRHAALPQASCAWMRPRSSASRARGSLTLRACEGA